MSIERSRTEQRRARMKALVKERRYTIYKRITIFFLVFIVGACIFSLLPKDKTYSETENRMLAQKPEFSISNLTSGKFMTDMEDYITDQFFLRNQWISLKLKQDLFLGKKESNGVYIGKKGHLLEMPDTPVEDALNKSIQSITDFAKKHSELNHVMTLVPNGFYVCDQYLPDNAPVRDQGEDILRVKDGVTSNVKFMDVTSVLKEHSSEEIYYKTDHHWTSLGAKYVFEEIAPALGISSVSNDYEVYPVTHDFQGTLSSKSGYMKSKDSIEIYVYNDQDTDCLVTYVDEQQKTASIYDSKALDQKDKYEVFFGGNHARIDISIPGSSGGNLLIFKDSYANCFIQFLLPYFKNIVMIDPRYYYDDIERIISEKSITDVLYLYNVNTFMGDNSLADILISEEESDDTTSQDVVTEENV